MAIHHDPRDTDPSLAHPDANAGPVSDAPGTHGMAAATGIGAVAGGVATGAAVGTVSGPVGVVIGAALGAVVGGLAGKAVGERINPVPEEDDYPVFRSPVRPQHLTSQQIADAIAELD